MTAKIKKGLLKIVLQKTQMRKINPWLNIKVNFEKADIFFNKITLHI